MAVFMLFLGMKKAILIVMLMLSAPLLRAQEVDGYGIPINSLNIQAADSALESVVGIVIGAFVLGIEAVASQGEKVDEITGWIPFVSAGYDYHFADTRWTLGPELGYWHIGLTSKEGRQQHFHFGVLAMAGKYFYKPAGICKLYGGLNLGAGLLASSGAEPSLIPAFQVNPIGMRLGGDNVAFVAELGVGYRGVIQLGLTVNI